MINIAKGVSLILFSIIFAYFSLISFFDSYRSYRKYFSATMLCIAFWCFMDSFVYLSHNKDIIIFAYQIEYLGINYASVFILQVLIRFYNITDKISKKTYLFLYIQPILNLLVIATNKYHKLFYNNMIIQIKHPNQVVIVEYGIAFWINIAFIYSVIIFWILFLYRYFDTQNKNYKKQALYCAIGIILGIVLGIDRVTYVNLPYDMTPITFGIFGITFYYGLFKSNIKKIIPIARDLVVDYIDLIYIVIDVNEIIVDINDMFLKTFKKDKKNIIGQKMINLFSQENHMNLYDQLLHNNKIKLLCNNEIKYYEISRKDIFNKRNNKIGEYIILKDVTITHEILEHLEYISWHDKLTGLYNRNYFEENFSNLDTKVNLPIGIIVADIDRLKETNDKYGHTKGDELIIEITKVIKNICNKPNHIITRMGGDEICILLLKTNKETVQTIINAINNQVSLINIYNIKGHISLGYAIKESMEQDIIDIYKIADQLMYTYKANYKKDLYLSESIHPISNIK